MRAVGMGRLARTLVVSLSAAAGAYWLLATYRCPSLEPSPSVGGGAHQRLTTSCPPSRCLAYPYLPFISLGRLCQALCTAVSPRILE